MYQALKGMIIHKFLSNDVLFAIQYQKYYVINSILINILTECPKLKKVNRLAFISLLTDRITSITLNLYILTV